jgi:soluble lytic murein transglycosylase-like protein
MTSLRKQKSEPTFGQGCLTTFFPTLLVVGVALLAALVYSGFSFSTQVNSSNNSSQMAQGATRMASFYAPSVLHWSKAVQTWAKEYALDANLIATVMQIESCGDPQALSSAGAQGLFQVMPFHFEAGENPSDPITNAHRGLSYLKQSLDASNGDVRKALAGYNGGISVIQQPEEYWAAETRRYADWGSRIYLEASQGKNTSRTLQEWLNSGGEFLCGQASQKLLTFQP